VGLAWILLLNACAPPPVSYRRIAADLEARTGRTVSLRDPVAANQPQPTMDADLPEGIMLDDGLSDDEAVSTALWNNAAFQETLADLGMSRADLVQARMLPNPTLSMFIPIGAKPLELTATLPFEFLWLRPRRSAIAEIDYDRVASRLVQNGLDLIRDVRVAYANVSQAMRQVSIVDDNAATTTEIAQIAGRRLAAGEISEIESDAAELDAATAGERATRAAYDVQLARQRLVNLMGLPDGGWSLATADQRLPLVSDDAAALVNTAMSSRPDLRAAELGLEAAGKRIGLARAETFVVAAGVNAKEVDGPFLAGPALNLAVPILNQNQGGVAIADAVFDKAARQYESTRQRIELEVRQAHSRLRQAQQSSATWNEVIVPRLANALAAGKNAYSSGSESFLFVLETSRRLTEARLNQSTALGDFQRARAELERSIGGRLPAADERGQGSDADFN